MPDVQTSFIPKKQPQGGGGGIRRFNLASVFVVISVIIFFISVAGYGGLFLYRILLTQEITDLSQSIDEARDVIRPSLIADLQTFDARVRSAEQVLENHTAVAPVLSLIEDTTIQTVRFTDMSYERNASGGATITLSGEAASYNSLAYQSEVLSENTFVENPVFSNFGLSNTGNVIFDAEFTVSPQLTDYRSTVSSGDTTEAVQQGSTLPEAEESEPSGEGAGAEESAEETEEGSVPPQEPETTPEAEQ